MPENMDYINFRKTKLSLGVGNSYPFDISLGIPDGQTQPGVVLVFPDGEERFIPLNATQQTIPSFQGRGFAGDPGGPISTDFTNRNFSPGIRLRANISTPGTNGQTVQYDTNSILVIRMFFTESEVIEGKFSYPSEQLMYNIASPLPDGAKITEATVKQMEMTLNVNNQFNVAGNAIIRLPQFRRVSDGAILSKQFRIEKKTAQQVTITNEFEAYKLVQDTADKNGYIDAARVQVDFTIDSTATNDKQLFKEADELTVSGKVTTLRFHEVKGLSMPQVRFNVNSETNFDVKGNISNLTFDELVLKELDINMVIKNGAGIKGILSGTADIFGKGGNKLATVNIADREIAAADFSTPGVYVPKETSINLNEKSLKLKEVPYSIKFNGNVRTVENEQFAVDATNRIDGKVVISIPLALRITGGKYTRDLTLLDIDADVRKREKNVDYAELKIESRNRMPANIGLAIHFYDANKNKILSVPTDAPTIAIPAAPTDANSVATGEAKSFQRVRLNNAQTKALLTATYYTVEATFSTDEGAESYAKFMLNDYLKLKMGLDFKGNTADTEE
jgi:hypothetical protein